MADRKKQARERADVLLVRSRVAASRQKAQSLILAGQVLQGDVPVEKPGQLFFEDAEFRLRGEPSPYVSRGAFKLKGAVEGFGVDIEGRVALDVGASTGGFTDYLLSRGARKVHAIDVGRNQMDWKLRSDPRVVVQEGINARHLKFEDIGEKVDLIVADVSFISLKLVLPALIQFAQPGKTDWVMLIKPQFEVGRDEVGKGGIVRSEEAASRAVEGVLEHASKLGLTRRGLLKSPLKGADGNQEYLAHLILEIHQED